MNPKAQNKTLWCYNILIFLDPPYFNADQNKFYTKSFGVQDHIRLCKILKKNNNKFKFLLTYDNCEEIREMYKWAKFSDSQEWNYVIARTDNQKEKKEIKVDSVLAFFGLKMELGPIVNWGLNLDKKTIVVNTNNFETNEKGIFAVGDICSYPGKLKLILCGFHEAALAAQECFKRAKPDEKYVFRFTTSSSDIHKRLGLK